MHIIVATDGSRQSLVAARYAKDILDPEKVTDVSVIAVVRPLAAVSFSNELSTRAKEHIADLSFRTEAAEAVDVIADVFEDWAAKVHKRIRSGSPANELIKAATQLEAGLVVVASGSRGISDTVLLGSTAQRVQQYAPCPVLVVRPAKRKRKPRTRAKD